MTGGTTKLLLMYYQTIIWVNDRSISEGDDMNTLSLNQKFIQVATPILSEFGFSGVKELVTEQLMLMLQSKIGHYEAECKVIESRVGQPFEVASLVESGSEDFEKDDSLNDWRFAREAVVLYQKKMQDILNA